MDNEKLKEQLRDMCIAADGLATAMHLFYANVSSDILDHIIEEAEKENIRQRNIRSFDEYMSKHHKKHKEQLDDILKNGMPDIRVERDPSFDDVSFQVKKLIDDFYATHDRAERLGIAEHILLVMFGQTPDELNGIMEKEARNLNSVISAIQHGNEETTHHCGQDAEEQHHNYRVMVGGKSILIHEGNVPFKICKVGGGNATVQDPNESQPADTVPESLKELVGMHVIKVCGPKCKDCPCGDGLREYPSGRDMSSCVKVELVGGYYLCLADLPNSIVTE